MAHIAQRRNPPPENVEADCDNGEFQTVFQRIHLRYEHGWERQGRFFCVRALDMRGRGLAEIANQWKDDAE